MASEDKQDRPAQRAKSADTETESSAPNYLGILRRLSQRLEDTVFCVAFTFLLGLVVATSLAMLINPLPKVHDEFSYLLAADGLSQMKTSAETHPFWQHFESFHIIHEPRYASKYPPGQGTLLAIGNWLGHPVIGICFSTAAAAAAIMWMLIGWIPKTFHWFVATLLATHPGLQIHWGQTYMGGAIAITGGALLLGSLFKIDKRFDVRLAFAAGIGIMLLMFSRPMEGAVLTATVICALFYKVANNKDWHWSLLTKKAVVPAGLIVACAFGILLAYNDSITGDPFQLPYKIHEEQYGATPLFLWQSPDAELPTYQHEVIRNFYEDDVSKRIENFASLPAALSKKLKFLSEVEYLFFGSSLAFAIFGLPFLLRQKKYWFAIAICIPAFAASLLTPWGHTHYTAPIGSVAILIGFAGVFEIWNRISVASTRRLIIGAVCVAHVFWFAKDTVMTKQKYQDSWWVARNRIEKTLKQSPKKDLVFVRYSDNHIPHQEWVYNRLNIDNSEVVWAREMSPEQDAELMDYFCDRNVWVIDPDNNGRKLFAIGEFPNSKFNRYSPSLLTTAKRR